LSTDALDVHFQVKVPTGSDLAPAMEALARWRDPEHGMVGPAQFIPIAEETGMIKRLTVRVLDVALGRCAHLRRTGISMRMAVNVSPKSLVDDLLPALVHDALRRHGLSGDAVQIEITESAAAANVARARPVIEALRALGVTLAIDDFGTGFSSLAQLQALPVEEIEIGRSFVLAFVREPRAEVIVRSIVTLGHSLGLKGDRGGRGVHRGVRPRRRARLRLHAGLPLRAPVRRSRDPAGGREHAVDLAAVAGHAARSGLERRIPALAGCPAPDRRAQAGNGVVRCVMRPAGPVRGAQHVDHDPSRPQGGRRPHGVAMTAASSITAATAFAGPPSKPTTTETTDTTTNTSRSKQDDNRPFGGGSGRRAG